MGYACRRGWYVRDEEGEKTVDWKEWSELTLNLCASTDSEDDNSREGGELGCEHSV